MFESRNLLCRVALAGMLVGFTCVRLPDLRGTELLGGQGDAEVDPDRRIQELIEQLGSPKYAVRQRAKIELRRMRLDAFDALCEAQEHEDIEIAISARYLVRSMQVNWWTAEDVPEVKQLLRGYGGRPEAERRNLMEQLAGMGYRPCCQPLCRLVRYEASEQLSRKASLLLMALELPEDEQGHRQISRDLVAGVGKSKRVAADWLRAYADLLAGAEDFQQHWAELIAHEQEELAQRPDNTSRELVRDLMKWYADQLLQLDLPDESLAMMRKSIDLLSPKEQELVESADWFRKRESWPVIVELAERFQDTFERSPMLQYRLANAYREMGHDSQADKAAQVALENVEAEPHYHVELAENLQTDGLFEWAELEYRHAAEGIDEQPDESVRAQLYLSEMLHDQGQELAAGQVLNTLIETVQNDETVRKVVEEDLNRELTSIKSRMLYFMAQHHAQQQDYDRQRKLLLEGVKNDSRDADVLIAMYRVVGADDEWREMTRKRIREATEFFREQIKEIESRLNMAKTFDERTIATFQLSLANNQLAWLVANTEGDFDESLRCSLKSLQLQPNNSGYLDTLGRCYYAQGDYPNAVKHQLQAVAREPHSPLMLRQLELFQEALRKKQANSEDADAEESPSQPD